MSLFERAVQPNGPYADSATNFIYELLFCDDMELFKKGNQQQNVYPWNVLFSDKINAAELQKIIGDNDLETRHKILAYNKLNAGGYAVDKKEILAVIVEVGLDGGLDVLASYKDGTARYINQTGKMILWDASDATSKRITTELFQRSENIVKQIGPWNEARRPFPAKGMVRISFLVSDGLYFGEAPQSILFNDPLAGPALISATQLMTYLTQQVLEPAG